MQNILFSCLILLVISYSVLGQEEKQLINNININCKEALNLQEANLIAADIIKYSVEALGETSYIKRIENIITIASCQSPEGTYTTEIHTNSKGYGYFKQVYDYKAQAFEAITQGKEEGFTLGNKIEKLPKAVVNIIRGHYFHQLILKPEDFFYDFGKVTIVEINNKKTYQLEAKDALNQECWLFFDIDTKLLRAVYIENSDNKKEIIKILFSDWKQVANLQLPHHLDINQNEKTYKFDFAKIIINSPKFEQKKLEKNN
ncbi:MAG: DUF4292 domain-containing protein [Acidobacteria bacterium]|nr:DUF4292 domain-containing protein [Acidobacteriota bacterium]